MGNIKYIAGEILKNKKYSFFIIVACALLLAISFTGCGSKGEDADNVSNSELQDLSVPDADMNDDNMSVVDINVPGDNDLDNMVLVSVDNLGRANPFLPPGESAKLNQSAINSAASVPQVRLQYDVLPPMENPTIDAGAKKVATTKVSGIMYDKISPSAILNIDGSDYFVRSGDVLNGYKVLSIGKSVVTVQVGANVYKAGVGQLVEEGQSEVNYNTVANLSSKFGGNKK